MQGHRVFGGWLGRWADAVGQAAAVASASAGYRLWASQAAAAPSPPTSTQPQIGRCCMEGAGAVFWSRATCPGTPCRWEQELELVVLLHRMYAMCSVNAGPSLWLFQPGTNFLREADWLDGRRCHPPQARHPGRRKPCSASSSVPAREPRAPAAACVSRTVSAGLLAVTT